MHTMQSVDDCTTLLSSASRRRMPIAYDTARQVCRSRVRTVTATKISATTIMGVTVSSMNRPEEKATPDTTGIAASASVSTARLRGHLVPYNDVASAAHIPRITSESHIGGTRGAP